MSCTNMLSPMATLMTSAYFTFVVSQNASVRPLLPLITKCDSSTFSIPISFTSLFSKKYGLFVHMSFYRKLNFCHFSGLILRFPVCAQHTTQTPSTNVCIQKCDIFNLSGAQVLGSSILMLYGSPLLAWSIFTAEARNVTKKSSTPNLLSLLNSSWKPLWSASAHAARFGTLQTLPLLEALFIPSWKSGRLLPSIHFDWTHCRHFCTSASSSRAPFLTCCSNI